MNTPLMNIMSHPRFVRAKVLDPILAERTEKQHAGQAFFDLTGSVLILEGAPIIQNELKKLERALEGYNKTLTETAGLYVRPKQTSRTNVKQYVYIGRYVYIRDHNLTQLQSVKNGRLLDEEEEEEEENTSKSSTKRTKKTKKSQKEKMNWIYVGKLEEILRAPDFKEVFQKVGAPPISVLDGVKYAIVINKGEITEHVILPYSLYIRPEINRLFSGLTFFKVSG